MFGALLLSARISARRSPGCFSGLTRQFASFLRCRSVCVLLGAGDSFLPLTGTSVQCLGCAHDEAAFVGGSCSHSHVFKRQRASTAASRPGPSTSGYEALASSTEDDLGGEMAVLLPGKSSQTSNSPARSVPLIEFLDAFPPVSLIA